MMGEKKEKGGGKRVAGTTPKWNSGKLRKRKGRVFNHLMLSEKRPPGFINQIFRRDKGKQGVLSTVNPQAGPKKKYFGVWGSALL